MAVYYNEIDPYLAQWLRNLIAAGELPEGYVDERSIVDISPADLNGYTHHHFFAGVGGWAYAARLAGWPMDAPLWTGSPPCQPFSQIGKKAGVADDRHLWPAWENLMHSCRPAVVVGEQVVGNGTFAELVCDTACALAYGLRGAVLPASCVKAPHRRERFYFVMDDPECPRLEGYPRNGPYNGLWPAAGRSTRETSVFVRGFDERVRHVEPGIPLVAHGIPQRVAKIRAFGNAIVPQVGALVLRAYMESMNG